MNQYLKDWERYTEVLGEYFVEKYFGKDAEHYWIADDIGGVMEVADCFFDIRDMVEFIKYRYSRKQMFEYYDYRLKFQSEKQPKNAYLINIQNYKLLKK